MNAKHPIGTRIRFTRTLDEPAGEDHPEFLYASPGEMGEITGHDAKEGYQVKTDQWPKWFGASSDEFEIVAKSV